MRMRNSDNKQMRNGNEQRPSACERLAATDRHLSRESTSLSLHFTGTYLQKLSSSLQAAAYSSCAAAVRCKT